MKLTTGGRARGRNCGWTDSEGGGSVDVSPRRGPQARVPALPLLGGLSKVLWVPPGRQQGVTPIAGLVLACSPQALLCRPLLRLQRSWGSGALGCGR